MSGAHSRVEKAMSSRFGLNDQQTKTIVDIFQSFCGSKRCTVWLFGSRAVEKHRAYSDIDFLIDCDPPCLPGEWSALSEAFDNSELPFKVDLVDAAQIAEGYRASIMSQRKLFWGNMQDSGKSSGKTER
jgi:uncharacterized protein